MALMFYVIIVVLGTAFSIVKYRLTDFQTIYGKFLINAAIGAILISIWLLLAYFGKRRVDKELEE